MNMKLKERIYISLKDLTVKSNLYLCQNKTGKSVQAMAIYGHKAFMLYHTGICHVFDLKSKNEIPIRKFRLGSYNKGVPDKRYANHANSAMFSDIFLNENSIPLLYVTIGNDGGKDDDGFIGRCAVENIRKVIDLNGNHTYQAETVQYISYNDEGIEETCWETPCWGWPASFVDSKNGWYYLFSARYRTTKENSKDSNKNVFIITKFKLPAITFENYKIVLTAKDIIDQFTTPFDIFITQGGTLYKEKIFYTFGFGTEEFPNGIRIYDLKKRCLVGRINLGNTILAHEEIESCAIYDGRLLCNTADENIYELIF